MSVEAEIQIVNQSDSESLCSPHQHLIRGPPMSLKFPVHWVAPHKECHPHCTGFVDHIRYDHVLPAPYCSTFFQINMKFQPQRPYLKKKENTFSCFLILNVIFLWFSCSWVVVLIVLSEENMLSVEKTVLYIQEIFLRKLLLLLI